MTTVALHGDFSTPARFRKDTGNPAFLNYYLAYKGLETVQIANKLRHYKDLNLIGYSRGGSIIADLTHYLTNYPLSRTI